MWFSICLYNCLADPFNGKKEFQSWEGQILYVCIMKHNFRQNLQTQSFLLNSFSCLNLTSAPSVGHSGMSTVIEQQQQQSLPKHPSL